MDKLLDKIRKEASSLTADEVAEAEGFDLDYTFGGNFDDAFNAGVDDGCIYFARSLVKMIEGSVDG